MTQISARLDCVENLTRHRHEKDQTENLLRAGWLSSARCSIAKVEHQRESSVLPNARGSRFRMGPSSDIRPRHSA